MTRSARDLRVGRPSSCDGARSVPSRGGDEICARSARVRPPKYMRRAAIRARADRAEDEPTRGGCGVAGSVPSLGVATALARYPRSRGASAQVAGGGLDALAVSHIWAGGGGVATARHLLCADALWTMHYALWTMDYALCTMDYALCTMHYGLWTMDYGLIASPTNAERCRGTAGQLRWAIGASAVHWRVSLSSLPAFLI